MSVALSDIYQTYLLTGLQWFPSVIDVIIVYFVIYRLLLWITQTHAESLVRGLFVVFLVYLLSHFLGLTVLNWLLAKFATVLIILLIIVFQPELRRFLEKVGTGNLFTPLFQQGEGIGTSVIKQILLAIEYLSEKKIGALIVIEAGTNLNEYIESGITMNAKVTQELLSSLFWNGSPTHDGAVIIRENRITAAGCLLPLTDTPLPDRRLGTRHRAALALSEFSDALIIVVSEETGIISLAEKGNLTRFLNKEALEARLFNLYREEDESSEDKPRWMKILKFVFKTR